MKRQMTTLLAVALATSCSKPAEPPVGPSKAPAPIAFVIKVDGMQRGQGGKT